MNIPMKKVCSCGKVWEEIPDDAKMTTEPYYAGFWWNCECKSTLFMPEEKLGSQASSILNRKD